jgi:hypothetical protein
MRKIINVIHQNEYSLESHEEFLSISKQIETPFSMSKKKLHFVSGFIIQFRFLGLQLQF